MNTTSEIIDSYNGCKCNGGGGGDISTATVVFINSASGKSYTVKPIWPVVSDEGLVFPDGIMNINVSSSQEVEIPMYKGKTVLPLSPNWLDNIDFDVTPTTTGGVSFDLPNVNITGDGTITFAGTKGGIA